MAEGLLQIISQKFSAKKRKYDAMHSKEVEKEMISKVSFMPEAWQLLIDSQTLSREAKHKALYGFLSREVSLGNIVRQELVSMIPAELLNVESHHYVFDMCASPGSKTDQLLSMLLTNKGSETGPATGMVVANDADPKRIQTLVKRFEHSGSPHLMFTCSRAEQLVSSKTGSPTEFFDRILCDVPCSGDGTFRKCSNLWRLFRYSQRCCVCCSALMPFIYVCLRPRMALELHEIQVQSVFRDRRAIVSCALSLRSLSVSQTLHSSH